MDASIAVPVVGARKHTTWSVADQIVSSASNALLPLVAFGLLDASDAGRLSVLLSFVFFALGVCRSLLGETFLLAIARAGDDASTDLHRDLCGTAFVLGAVFGLGTGALCAAFLHPLYVAPIVSLGFALVVVQDTARYTFFAHLDARRAVVSDVLWLLLFIVAVVLRSRATAATLLVMWISAGAVAGLVALWQLGVVPKPTASIGVARKLAGLGGKIAAEYVAVSGLPQALIAITGAASLATAAGYRLATTVLTPAGVIVTGVVTALQPMCVRAKDQPSALRRHFVRAGSVGALAVVGCVLAVWIVPTGLGNRLLGASFVGGRRLTIPLAVAGIAQSVSAAANLVVRARDRVMDAVRIRYGFGATCLLAAVPAARLWGGTGVAWIYAATSIGALAALVGSPALRFRVTA